MSKARKILSLVLLVLMVSTTLSMYGCTTNSTTKDTGEKTQVGSKDTKQSQEPVKITLWTAPDWKGVYDPTVAGANYGDFYKFAGKDFVKENSNVTVNVESVPGADRDAKLSIAIQSHTQPDIYVGADFTMFDYVHNGLIVPLNDVITDADKQDIPASIWDGVTANGNIYMFPYYTETGHMALNVDLFKQAGAEALIPKGGANTIVRWTPDEFKDALRAVKKLDGVYPFAFYCGSTQGDTYNILLLEMFGAKLFNKDGTQVTINDANGVKALEFIKSLKDEGLLAPGAESLNVLDVYQLFLNKKTAVSIFNNVNYDALNNGLKAKSIQEPFNIQMAFLPSAGDPMCYAYAMGSVVFDSGNELQTQTAKQFVKFYTNEPYVDASMSMLPLRKSVAQKLLDPLKVKIAESAEFSVSFSQKAPGYLKLRASLFPELQAFMTGQKTAQQALDSYAKNANAILKDGVANSVLLNGKK
ncbi:MAG TPA: extracellular solute-binding protein [Ruminiclostridium sp.]